MVNVKNHMSSDVSVVLQLGEKYISKGQYLEALFHYQRAKTSTDPNSSKFTRYDECSNRIVNILKVNPKLALQLPDTEIYKKDVRRAYKRIILLYHPDKNVEVDTSLLFTVIQSAYEYLIQSAPDEPVTVLASQPLTTKRQSIFRTQSPPLPDSLPAVVSHPVAAKTDEAKCSLPHQPTPIWPTRQESKSYNGVLGKERVHSHDGSKLLDAGVNHTKARRNSGQDDYLHKIRDEAKLSLSRFLTTEELREAVLDLLIGREEEDVSRGKVLRMSRGELLKLYLTRQQQQQHGLKTVAKPCLQKTPQNKESSDVGKYMGVWMDALTGALGEELHQWKEDGVNRLSRLRAHYFGDKKESFSPPEPSAATRTGAYAPKTEVSGIEFQASDLRRRRSRVDSLPSFASVRENIVTLLPTMTSSDLRRTCIAK